MLPKTVFHLRSQVFLLVLLATGAAASAAEWTYEWTPAEGEGNPVAEICPLKYGKTWAYSIEIDDGKITALTGAAPFLQRYSYTDAPPGVAGGRENHFAGTAAIYPARTGTPNGSFLNWSQIRELLAMGWDVVSHSYSHQGDLTRKAPLAPAVYREEIYWAQALLAANVLNGRGPGHLVFPNGDDNYRRHFAEFGLRSGSRVSGSSPRNLLDAKFLPEDLDRNYLDESYWTSWGKGDPLVGFPKDGPKPGDFIIDFTHDILPDPVSPNQKRWRQRLDFIASRYGKAGDGSVWCASSAEVVEYAAAARAASLQVSRGKVTLSVPDSAPGAALTVRISGLSPDTSLPAPADGVVYRQGDVAWVTAPFLAPRGAAVAPRVRCAYKGPVDAVTFPSPVRIAAVRLCQFGPAKDAKLEVTLGTANGPLAWKSATLQSTFGVWHLFSSIPEVPASEAPLASAVDVSRHPSLREMEVWTVDEPEPAPSPVEPVPDPAASSQQ